MLLKGLSVADLVYEIIRPVTGTWPWGFVCNMPTVIPIRDRRTVTSNCQFSRLWVYAQSIKGSSCGKLGNPLLLNHLGQPVLGHGVGC